MLKWIVGEIEKIKEMVTKSKEEILERIDELVKIFSHRHDEIEKRVMLIQRKIYGESFDNIFDYIREKVVVDKEELITSFPFLASRYKFVDFKKNLPPDIRYIQYSGTKLAKFVCVEDIAVEKAVEAFFSAEFKKLIKINCPDERLKNEIKYWIMRIFDGYVTKIHGGEIVKGVVVGATKRGHRIIRKERRV